MSLKDSLQHTFRRLSEDVLPGALAGAGEKFEDIRKRLDHLNCSLAERALPEDRRPRVSELSIRRKATRAGQKAAKLKVVNGAKKSGGSKPL